MVKKHVVTEGCANLGIHLGIQGVESEFLGHLVPRPFGISCWYVR